jgi:hypothetical protein
LLSLGLKKETADMCWMYGEVLSCNPPELAVDIPAWSLGRLVEMTPNSIHNKRILAYLTIMNDRVLYDTIKNETYSAFTNKNGLFAAVVDAIEWLIKEGYFNKEYLVNQAEIEEHCKGVLEYLDYIRGEEE